MMLPGKKGEAHKILGWFEVWTSGWQWWPSNWTLVCFRRKRGGVVRCAALVLCLRIIDFQLEISQIFGYIYTVYIHIYYNNIYIYEVYYGKPVDLLRAKKKNERLQWTFWSTSTFHGGFSLLLGLACPESSVFYLKMVSRQRLAALFFGPGFFRKKHDP